MWLSKLKFLATVELLWHYNAKNSKPSSGIFCVWNVLLLLHTSPLGRPCQKKCPADYLFGFHLHMTPRLWEDVSELQKQAKSWDNVIFSALGPPRKSWGTYFYVKSKNKWGPLSSLFSILAIKMHFLSFFCYFPPPHHFSCKLAKNAL